jgi:hypothetical protein
VDSTHIGYLKHHIPNIQNFHQKSVTLPPTKNFMESIKVHDKTFVPYLEDTEIQEIVKATALKIHEDYKMKFLFSLVF